MMDTTLLLKLLLIGVLLAAASGMGLVWLRRSRALQMQRRAGLLPRVRRLGREFSGLVRHQPANPGEPYASRLAEAVKSIRQGWERSRQVDAELERRRPECTAEPLWRLFLLIPLYGEIGLRLLEWLELGWLALQTRRAEHDLTQAQQRLGEIAGLGKTERSALEELRNHIKTLHSGLAEHRLNAALNPERQKLDELAEKLAQYAAQLGEQDPTPAQVAEIHPVRLKSEQEVQQIRLALRAHEASHGRLQPRLSQQRERLAAFEQALAAEEGRRPAPLLRERTLAARQLLAQQEEALGRGEYSGIEARLADIGPRLKEMEDTLKKLSGLRTHLNGAQQQTSAALVELRQWMRQFPAPLVLDAAQEQVRALQTKLQEQSRAAALEDPAELERAGQTALDEIHKTMSHFERGLEHQQRLAAQLAPEAVEGLQKRGEHLSARLKLRHASYQEKARVSHMDDHLARLAENWKTIAAANPNLQSDLLRLAAALPQLESAWNELERATRRAMEVIEQVRAQQERAAACLEDEAFGEIQPLAQLEDTEWAPEATALLELHRQLVERTGRGDEDFGAVLNAAAQLQKAAAKLSKEYQFRLARAQTETTQLVQALNPCADRLDRLIEHPYLEFDERAVGILNEMRIWLGQAQTQNGLERRAALAARGSQLRMEAELFCRGLEADQLAAEQDRAWTEDMLVTAEEYQGVTRQQQGVNTFNGELAAARALLETARRKLGALSAPRRKYPAAEYRSELADVRQMITGARSHIDNAQV